MVWCGVCGVVWCGVVCVVWCGVVWCVWCGVVWCGVCGVCGVVCMCNANEWRCLTVQDITLKDSSPACPSKSYRAVVVAGVAEEGTGGLTGRTNG